MTRREELISKFKVKPTANYIVFWKAVDYMSDDVPFALLPAPSTLQETYNFITYKDIAISSTLPINEFTSHELEMVIRYIDHITDDLIIMHTPLEERITERY